MQQFITILNVIKKGEGNRPYEALATLRLVEKVLNSICLGGIDNTCQRTIPNYFLDRIMHPLLGKEAIPTSLNLSAGGRGIVRSYYRKKKI